MSVRTLFFALFAIVAIDAQAATVTLLGRPIEVVIPNGYCEAGNHPADAEMVRRTREGIGNSNQIIVLFADCKELEDFRKDKRTMIDNYGQMLAQQTPKGQILSFKGVSRAEYIQKISDRSSYFPEAFKKAEARAKEFIPGNPSIENLGLLSTDSNGLYFGLLMVLSNDTGKLRTVVGVSGMTLVKERSISINLYQVYKKTPDLRGLLTRQQSAMANFVRSNN